MTSVPIQKWGLRGVFLHGSCFPVVQNDQEHHVNKRGVGLST